VSKTYSFPPDMPLPLVRYRDTLALFELREEVLQLFGQPIKVITDPLMPAGTIQVGDVRIVNVGEARR
jgi:hypothetical protein